MSASVSAKRNVGLDLLRCLAIVMIVCCHLLQSVGVAWGGVLGGVGNCLFFVLSGLGLGLWWRSKGKPSLGFKFLAARTKRIYPAFALLLVAYVISLVVLGYGIRHRDVILNFAMLSWFAKLPGAGHLWFVTAISAFYVILAVLVKLALRNSFVAAISFIVCCAVGQLLTSMFGIRQAYVFTMWICGGLAFLYADTILNFICKCKLRACGFALWILSASCVVALLAHQFRVISVSYYWSCMTAAILLTLPCLTWCRNWSRLPVPLAFVSGISYEVYLLHHPLCSSGPWYLRSLGGGYVIFVIMLSLAGGWLLHLAVVALTRKARKKDV